MGGPPAPTPPTPQRGLRDPLPTRASLRLLYVPFPCDPPKPSAEKCQIQVWGLYDGSVCPPTTPSRAPGHWHTCGGVQVGVTVGTPQCGGGGGEHVVRAHRRVRECARAWGCTCGLRAHTRVGTGVHVAGGCSHAWRGDRACGWGRARAHARASSDRGTADSRAAVAARGAEASARWNAAVPSWARPCHAVPCHAMLGQAMSHHSMPGHAWAVPFCAR